MFKRELTKPDGRKLWLYSEREIQDNIEATNPTHEPIEGKPHLRWHPLRGEWVAFASHRQNRTFLPPKDYSPLAVTRSKDFPTEMPAGDYDVAVFENLFPSLDLKADSAPDLYVPTRPANGACEVVVFTQDPESSLAQLPLSRVKTVLEVLGERTKELGLNEAIQYVLPFENRGVEVGVTLHHPHGQIYSYPFVPPLPERQLQFMKAHYEKHQRSLLADLVTDEMREGHRLITTTSSAVAFIPAFARYPYETYIAPKRAVSFIHELNDGELSDLARVVKTVLMKFDGLWTRPFPYLMVLYQAPTDGKSHPYSHLHFQIYPPYRTKDRLKFLAGTELGAGMFVNDSLPEEKAKELRAVEVSV
jgi:UDPglucose--hexose-1-phosphate uridylyltransferase